MNNARLTSPDGAAQNVGRKEVPGDARFDAVAGYALNEDISLQLNLRNLTDKLYFGKVSSPHYAGVAPGRSATLTANLEF